MRKVRNLIFGIALTTQATFTDHDIFFRRPGYGSQEPSRIHVTDIYEDNTLRVLNQKYDFLRAYLEFLTEEAGTSALTLSQLQDTLANGKDIIKECFESESNHWSRVILEFRIRLLENYIASHERTIGEKIYMEQLKQAADLERCVSRVTALDPYSLTSLHNTRYISHYFLQSLLPPHLVSEPIVSQTSFGTSADTEQISDPLFLSEKVKKRVKVFMASRPQVNIHLATSILTSIPGITITQDGKGDHGSICRNNKAINTIDKGGLIGGNDIPLWLFVSYQTKGHMGNPAAFTEQEIHFGIAKAKGYLK